MPDDVKPENAVARLRKLRVASSTRPFRARGSRVIRCEQCQLPASHCLCHTFSAISSVGRFCLVMYDTEPMKPSNTGRLIADILPTTQAFLWSRTQVDEALLALLNDDRYQPYIVFPASYASPGREVAEIGKVGTHPLTDQKVQYHKPALFILLDGTWPEACKMFRKSPYLDRFPVLGISTNRCSSYTLRESHHLEQLCTVEVAIELLKQTGDTAASEALDQHFTRFKQYYLAAKFNRPIST